MTKKPFVAEWLKDTQKKSYDRMTIDPTRKQPNIYNLWRGFVTEGLPKLDPAFVAQEMQPFLHHVRYGWTANFEEAAKWIMELFSHMYQHPEKKPEVAVLLFGEEGCGKGMLLEFLREKVFGEKCTAQCANLVLDVFDKFANKVLGNVLLQVDEVGESRTLASQLKNFITARNFRFEKKGRDPVDVPNLVTLFFTTNDAVQLPISPKDRRYAFFQCVEMDKDDPEYIPRFVSYLAQPHIPQVVAQYLASMDLSKYETTTFQKTRPLTNYYKESRKNNIPMLSRFLSALINTGYGLVPALPETRKVRVDSKKFLDEYRAYYEDASNDRKHTPTSVGLGRDISRYTSIVKHTYTSSLAYEFDHDKTKAELVELNQFDQNAYFSIKTH
jgi:hypothetical protein